MIVYLAGIRLKRHPDRSFILETAFFNDPLRPLVKRIMVGAEDQTIRLVKCITDDGLYRFRHVSLSPVVRMQGISNLPGFIVVAPFIAVEVYGSDQFSTIFFYHSPGLPFFDKIPQNGFRFLQGSYRRPSRLRAYLRTACPFIKVGKVAGLEWAQQ